MNITYPTGDGRRRLADQPHVEVRSQDPNGLMLEGKDPDLVLFDLARFVLERLVRKYLPRFIRSVS